MSLADSVQAGLDQLAPLDARDRAVADLALRYAEALDAHLEWVERISQGEAEEGGGGRADDRWRDRQRDPLAELGPKLLAALVALQLTPAARATATKGPDKTPTANPLDRLRDDLAEARKRRGG